ncbi:MAG: DUF2461 domain-containing protein [Pedobacter sp.]|nr:MAG: DUF2461 domain-containing protein [Pedobacter sp.]
MLKASTLAFLKLIAKNNNREWFNANKALYEAAKLDIYSFIETLLPIFSGIDPHLSSEASPKKILMRIYRDVRFSKNKDPYKLNYGLAFDVRNYGPRTPSYYIHIAPGNCFMGIGFWQPEAEVLKQVREEIDYNADKFLSIINAPEFKQFFSLSQEDKLKTAPKGYEKDHSLIEYLRLKSFIAIMPIAETEFLNEAIVEKLKTAFQNIQPFVLFLRDATQIDQ